MSSRLMYGRSDAASGGAGGGARGRDPGSEVSLAGHVAGRSRRVEQACRLCDDYRGAQGPSVLRSEHQGWEAGVPSRCARG